MSWGLLFPGQGTQHAGMLGWVDACPEAAPMFAALAVALGEDWRARLGDGEWASGNAVAQTLLTALPLAAWQALAPRLPPPSVVAGYSVGELPAFCAAGVFDAASALRLAQQRAAAMDSAAHAPGVPATGLLSVTGPGNEAIAALCREHGLAVAIRLAADRRLLGGPLPALAAAQAALQGGAAQVQRLPISLASHTPWMQTAVPEFATALETIAFAPPRSALVCNFSGSVLRQPAALKAALAGQIASTVDWAACQQTVAERLPRCVLELGPGSTLAKLWNEQHPDIPARSADEFRSAEAVAAWVRAELRDR